MEDYSNGFYTIQELNYGQVVLVLVPHAPLGTSLHSCFVLFTRRRLVFIVVLVQTGH